METEKTNALTTKVQPPSVIADEGGVLRPRNLEEAWRIADAFLKSGILPTRFKSVEQVFTAMQFANELGLQPLTALRQIAVVNGTPSIYGDLPLSLCYAKGLVESIREYIVDENNNEIFAANKNLNAKPFGAVCIFKRRYDAELAEKHFTMEDAKIAGLLRNPTWQTYPKYMLKYRARSQALKDKCPDALNGVAIAEYDYNIAPQIDGILEITGAVANTGTAESDIYTATPEQQQQIKSWFQKFQIEEREHAKILKELNNKKMSEAEEIIKTFGKKLEF